MRGARLCRSGISCGMRIRADRVDRAEAQRRGELVLALLGDVLDRRRFLEHALRLLDDAVAHRCHRHFAAAALEKRHAELVLQLLDRDRQRRLAHEAFFRRAPEVALAGERDDVTQLGQRHAEINGRGPTECSTRPLWKRRAAA